MKITISKSQWEEIGKKTGWMKEASYSTDTKPYDMPKNPKPISDINPKMMPGQTPYTPEELEKLQGLVSGAAKGDPGEQDENDLINRRRFVKVTFDDGDVIQTSINGTKKEIEDYYLKQEPTDTWDEKRIHKPVKVEFIS